MRTVRNNYIDRPIGEFSAKLQDDDIAEEVGSPKIVNVLLIGALSSLIDFDISIWTKAIDKFAPPKFRDLNMKAFQKGRSLMEEL